MAVIHLQIHMHHVEDGRPERPVLVGFFTDIGSAYW